MVFGVKRVRGGWLEEQCEQAEYANGEYFADLCDNLSIDVGLGVCRLKASLLAPNYALVPLHLIPVAEYAIGYGMTWFLVYVLPAPLSLLRGMEFLLRQRNANYLTFEVALLMTNIMMGQYVSYRGNNNRSAMPPPSSFLL
jgi:hypothetical protein